MEKPNKEKSKIDCTEIQVKMSNLCENCYDYRKHHISIGYNLEDVGCEPNWKNRCICEDNNTETGGKHAETADLYSSFMKLPNNYQMIVRHGRLGAVIVENLKYIRRKAPKFEAETENHHKKKLLAAILDFKKRELILFKNVMKQKVELLDSNCEFVKESVMNLMEVCFDVKEELPDSEYKEIMEGCPKDLQYSKSLISHIKAMIIDIKETIRPHTERAVERMVEESGYTGDVEGLTEELQGLLGMILRERGATFVGIDFTKLF